MANLEQQTDKYETFQQAIDSGEVNYLTLTKGKGQNQSTKIFEIDRILEQVMLGSYKIKDIEKAISLYYSGSFTLAGHNDDGRMVHKYSFEVTKVQDQNQREEIANFYHIDLNATNPRQQQQNNNGNGNGNGSYSSVFNNGNNGNNNNANNNNAQMQQLLALKQLLGMNNQQQQQPNNDLFGMLNTALAPQQLNQSLQYYKQEIENVVKEVKREFENSKVMHNNEIMQYKNEQINRNAEHKKELADLATKYENQIRDMQNRFDPVRQNVDRSRSETIVNLPQLSFSEFENLLSAF